MHDDGHLCGQGVLDGAGELLAGRVVGIDDQGLGPRLPRDGLANEIDLSSCSRPADGSVLAVSSAGRMRSRALSKPACACAAVASIVASSGSCPRAAINSMLRTVPPVTNGSGTAVDGPDVGTRDPALFASLNSGGGGVTKSPEPHPARRHRHHRPRQYDTDPYSPRPLDHGRLRL